MARTLVKLLGLHQEDEGIQMARATDPTSLRLSVPPAAAFSRSFRLTRSLLTPGGVPSPHFLLLHLQGAVSLLADMMRLAPGVATAAATARSIVEEARCAP